MDSEKRKDLAIEFINKLIEGANNSCQTKYKLRFANSTNPFFKKHNIFRRTIKEKIINFTINNYHYGPTQDHDGYPGKVWEFGFNFRHLEIYIKFRIHNYYIVCFKIHESKKCIRYPYR